MSTLDHWLSRHDLGGLELKNVQYRPGAVQTSPFGLCQGYRIVKDDDGVKDIAEWGWARIHTGTDRANARSGDVVVCPLPHEETHIIDYNGEGYGSLIRLVSYLWCYEFRIAHMEPTADIEPDVLDALCENKPIPLGKKIGRAGSYGVGTGKHTHTELVAWSQGASMFDELLTRVHGNGALVHETTRDVLDMYRTFLKWKLSTDEERLQDYALQRTYRGIDWSNKYRHHYTDPILGREAWRYSTWLLGGL